MSTVKLVRIRRFEDVRGWFSEVYNARNLAEIGIQTIFVQDNHSMSRPVGTVRGLHFQTPPHGQHKLVRCLRGAIFDVAVDIRKGSPTYGRSVSVTLTGDNNLQLFVPIGFAHGFITLEPDTEVTYKVSNFYAPQADAGILWNDPALAIPWPVPESGAVLSDKDVRLPLMAEFDSPFAYDGVPLAPLEA